MGRRKSAARTANTHATPPTSAARTRGPRPRTELRTAPVLISLGLIFAIFAAYHGLCGKEAEFFCLDDGEYVQGNPQVHAGLTPQSVAWAFTTFYRSKWH